MALNLGKRIVVLERVTVLLNDGVADVRLDRPAKMNAIDGQMFEAVAQTIELLAASPGIRAVVLSGSGGAFCAGLDKDSFSAALDPSRRDETAIPADLLARTHGDYNLPQFVAAGWRDLPMPVIVAITGVAFGGGLQIALGGDIRYGAPDCKLSAMEIRWGLVPDMAGTWLMRDLVRSDIMRELLLTGRTVGAAEAEAIGLITRTEHDPLEAAFSTARQIALLSPRAIRAVKRLLNRSQHGNRANSLVAEAEEQTSLLGSPEQQEAVRANLERRVPRFYDGKS
jgi:enoyl-CoA hydratase/carnithine racemase